MAQPPPPEPLPDISTRQLIGGGRPIDKGLAVIEILGGVARFSRYYEGDEYKPYDWADDQVATLQARLVSAGFLDPDVYAPGIWDPSSAAAYRRALFYANQVMLPVEQVLDDLAGAADSIQARARRAGGGGGLGVRPLTDDDIKALANQAARQVLGRTLRDEETAQFIPAFRGVIATGTSTQTAAMNLVREQQPEEAFGHDVGNVLQILDDMLGGG
jgi:hypothetical protein